MKFLKRRNLVMLLGGTVAGSIGLFAAVAILGSPTASAYPGQSTYCDSCHGYPSSTLKISVDKTAVTVVPGGTFTVTTSFTGGNAGGTTEINWPTTFSSSTPRDNSLFNPSPRSSDSSNAGTGSSTTTLTAPSTAGTYTVRVYASRKSPLETDYKDIKVTVATPAPATYTLTYVAGANGSLTGTLSQSVTSGGSGTAVTAAPNTGYHFVNWSDGSTQNPRTDTNVTANKSVTANFAINTYTLNYAAGANGTLTGTASQTINYNASGTSVTAVPNTGYHFVSWSDGKTANPRTDSSVTSNVNVTASFAADAVTNYTLAYSAGANGSISGTASQTVASGGSGTAVTAVPNTGYHFVNWSDSSTANPRTDTNVTASISVTANFAIDTHTITVTPGANGTITPGTETVNHASDATFTIAADTGYHILSVVVDDSPLVTTLATTPSTTYTFINVTSNHSISATFAADAPAADIVGPTTSNLKITPKISKRTNPASVTLSAIVDDTLTGGSPISGAEYFIDTLGTPGTGTPMVPLTNVPSSSRMQESATLDLATMTAGRHTIYVHGKDSSENWGPAARIRIRVIISTTPSSSTQRITATTVSDDDWNRDDDDSFDEIEVDENSKGDVIQIVDHTTSGQNITLWPNDSSEYTDSH